jgi:hypothetical protein
MFAIVTKTKKNKSRLFRHQPRLGRQITATRSPPPTGNTFKADRKLWAWTTLAFKK